MIRTRPTQRAFTGRFSSLESHSKNDRTLTPPVFPGLIVRNRCREILMKPSLRWLPGQVAIFAVILSGMAGARADVFERWNTNQVSSTNFGLSLVTYAGERFVAYGSHSDYGVILSSEDGK